MTEKSDKRKILFAVSVILTAAMMIFIFARSEKTAVESTAESDVVVEAVEPVLRPAVVAAEEKKLEKKAAGRSDGKDSDGGEKAPEIKLTEKYIRKCIEHIVRKCAHFGMYAVLGFLVMAAVWFSPAAKGEVKRLPLCGLAALGISALYAAGDELHQYFIPGRSMELRDMMIDACGALTGTAVCALIIFALCRIKSRNGGVKGERE